MGRALYKTLVDDILLKITTDEIKVGDRLPPESKYAEHLGVSRSTLRQAFAQLEQIGIIKRRKRGGTEVISDKPVKRYNMVSNGFYDVLSVARDNLLIVTDLSLVDQHKVEILSNHDGVASQWLKCCGSRYMAGQSVPFAVLKVYIPDHYSEINLHIGDSIGAVFVKVEECYGVSPGRVKRQIGTTLCSGQVAKILGIEQGSAVMTIHTEIEDSNGGLIELIDSIIDPNRFSVVSDIVVGG